MKIVIHHYNAFTTSLNRGNPAGVVFHADGLSDADMQAIAHKVGSNAMAFVLKSESADQRIRYVTLRHEMPLYGHATFCSVIRCDGRLHGKVRIGLLRRKKLHFTGRAGL